MIVANGANELVKSVFFQFGLAIHQNDHQARRRFVEWAQNVIAVVPDFHKRILFSDEAPFWLNGYVNKQNCRIWREANPQVRILEIKLINSFPPKIIWRYGIYPKLFDKMSDIEFHEGMLFDVEDITNAFVIIDDLMNEVGDDKRTFKLVHERKPS
ncbi:hypothetical protein TNCV_3056261 [Trichonephila clavipes]|nr:hypothetical protein TNCV_3056261 [Trichonephila clavipes]